MRNSIKHKSAIIPYRFVDEQLELLLIRNASNTRWIIPQGNVDLPLHPQISATKEAYEEAGVLGRPHPIMVGTYTRNEQQVKTYLLEVDVELKHYEEEDFRNRRWILPEEISAYILEEELKKLLILGVKCVLKPGTYFKCAMQTFCEEHELTVQKLSKRKLRLEMEYQPGLKRRILVLRFGTTLEFCIPTDISFSSLADIPSSISSQVLLENADHTVGFWCLHQKKSGLKFSRNHNIEMRLLNAAHFRKILEVLIERCVVFEEYYLLDEGLTSQGIPM